MFNISTQSQLQHLRPGDRLNYCGVEWQVVNYSTYKDPHGYETAEWLLQSHLHKEYYLLREVDQNSQTSVRWYLAEEIRRSKVFQPGSRQDLSFSLWNDMQGGKIPYPELQVFDKVYYFESQTTGGYQDEDEQETRITWDYWDAAHQWNLAFEAWLDGSLAVYLTKLVNPEDFSKIKKDFITQKAEQYPSINRAWQLLGACCLVIVGLIIMIFG